MFVVRVLLVAAACLFCVPAMGQQCANGHCYQPAFSSVSGKVLRSRTQLADGSWGPWETVDGTTGAAFKSPTQTSGLMPGEINRDSRAYAHAKKEAQMLASGMWYNSRRTGHPLGTAPGCSFSGCGVSFTGSPNHCYRNLGDSRIVARACVYRNGRYYWSAHLR